MYNTRAFTIFLLIIGCIGTTFSMLLDGNFGMPDRTMLRLYLLFLGPYFVASLAYILTAATTEQFPKSFTIVITLIVAFYAFAHLMAHTNASSWGLEWVPVFFASGVGYILAILVLIRGVIKYLGYIIMHNNAPQSTPKNGATDL